MASPSFVQCVGVALATTSAGSIASGSQSTTTGNYIIAFVFANGASTSVEVGSVTDTAGNTYSRAGSYTPGQQYLREFWITTAPITGNAANVVTASFSGGTGLADYREVVQIEVSMASSTAMAFDAEATVADLTQQSTHTSNSVTTTGAERIVIGVIITYSNAREVTISTGTAIYEDNAFPNNAPSDYIAAGYRIAATAGAYSLAWTTDGNTDSAIYVQAYKFTVSGGGYATAWLKA